MKTIFDYMLQHQRNDRAALAVRDHGFDAPLRKSATFFERFAQRVGGWASLRRTQTELRSLSDRQLEDLGLTRDQVEDPASWPRHRIGSRF